MTNRKLANIVKEQGIDTVAVSYTNNDYGKGLADSFSAAFQALGGTIAISAAHEDGKADYSAEVAALQASGAPALMVFGYVDQGGVGIVQALDLMVATHIARGELVEILSDHAASGPTLSVLSAPGRTNSPKVRAFIDFALEIMGTQPRR